MATTYSFNTKYFLTSQPVITKGRLTTGRPCSLLTAHRLLLCRHQLGQPALLPCSGILVDDALLRGAIQKLDRFGIRGGCLGAGCGSNLPERGAKGTPVSAVVNGTSTTLTHALGGGLDTRSEETV